MKADVILCRCCGRRVYSDDNCPIHTRCIPNHWGKHSNGINSSRCKEFKGKNQKTLREQADLRRQSKIDSRAT